MRSTIAFICALFACCTVQVQAQPSLLDSTFVSRPPYGVFSWDWEITRSINSIDDPFVNRVSDILSASVIPVGVGLPGSMLASANLQWFTRDAAANRYLGETGALALASEAGTVLMVVALKELTARERPYLAHPGEIVGRVDEILSSFPSGHTALSASMATMVSLRYPYWYVIAPSALWTLAVGCSRMHLGVHYFTDVVAGAVFGGGMALLVYGLRTEILPQMEFMLPDAPPDAASQNAKIKAAAENLPLGLSATPQGASLNFSFPIGR